MTAKRTFDIVDADVADCHIQQRNSFQYVLDKRLIGMLLQRTHWRMQ